MSIQTRRNAIVGWATIMIGKYFARKKAAEIVEPPKRTKLWLSIGAVVAAGVAVGGALAFWRRGGSPDDTLDEALDEAESKVESEVETV